MRIIAGEWKGRRLHPLRGRGVRPTTDRVREAWMSALGGDLTGLRVADLFAGSGALGLEALSRGAVHAVFVERAPSSLRVLRANIALVEAGSRADVVATDVFRYLERGDLPLFDVVLADPPYAGSDAQRLVDRFLRAPFAQELWVEHRSRTALELPAGARTRVYGDTALTRLPGGP